MPEKCNVSFFDIADRGKYFCFDLIINTSEETINIKAAAIAAVAILFLSLASFSPNTNPSPETLFRGHTKKSPLRRPEKFGRSTAKQSRQRSLLHKKTFILKMTDIVK